MVVLAITARGADIVAACAVAVGAAGVLLPRADGTAMAVPAPGIVQVLAAPAVGADLVPPAACP